MINPTIQHCGVEILSTGAEIVMAPDGKEDTFVSYLSFGEVSAVVTRVEQITRRVIENGPGLE